MLTTLIKGELDYLTLSHLVSRSFVSSDIFLSLPSLLPLVAAQWLPCGHLKNARATNAASLRCSLSLGPRIYLIRPNFIGISFVSLLFHSLRRPLSLALKQHIVLM